MNCRECGREYEPRQEWIHSPCRYAQDVTPNHIPEDKRGPISVTETVTDDAGVTESVTVPVTSNAERQRRYRERQKGKVVGIAYG
jgi:hypothetical protein